ncbi:MAG: DUF4395 family protein [Gemmatimonadetes bacterium]|nr:DUF4395 family protein [Gemmatimonadota bacterium]
MSLSASVRRRLEMQGFVCRDDPEFEKLTSWFRLTPALCTGVIVAGTGLASPAILLGLAPIAALGALLPVHPFDLLYNFGLRHVVGTGPLPRNGAPRRFACGVVALWLAATGYAFVAGAVALGYALGALLTLAAGTVAVSHFCVASWMYQGLFARRVATRA